MRIYVLRFFITVLISSLLLLGCTPKATPMTPQETQRVAQFTEAMSPRCFGRHLMDMPKAFVINSDDTAQVEKVKIKIEPMAKAVFDLRLQARERELRALHMDGKPSVPFLRRIESSPNVADGKIFNRAEDSMSEIGRILELMSWRDGYALFLTIGADDYGGAGFHRADDPPDNTMERISILLKVYDRTRGRAEAEIPTEPGLCIANGFVRGPANDQEEMNIPYVLAGTPDVFFNFVYTTKIHENDTLLERSGKTEKEMKAAGTETVRKGKREINSLPYEEWLMRGPTPDHVPGTMFALHGNETSADPAKPFITLGFFNGYRIPAPPRTMEESAQLKDLQRASLTEAEAVGIWDKVTATMRLRPGAF